MASHVLVLGAGASVHYTFPLARELVRRVVKGSDMPRPTRMEQLGFELNAYDGFVRRLRMSGVTSVDQFAPYLDDPADIHIAKAPIAYYLACCEQRDDLTAPDRTDHREAATVRRLKESAIYGGLYSAHRGLENPPHSLLLNTLVAHSVLSLARDFAYHVHCQALLGAIRSCLVHRIRLRFINIKGFRIAPICRRH
jgi:hypothetical protein